MKTLKKVLCTTLAAVSLSAFVAVPSTFNAPNSGNSLVNVLEAQAVTHCFEYTFYVAQKDGNFRNGHSLNDPIVGKFKKGDIFIGFDKYKNFVKTSRYYEDSKWIYTGKGHIKEQSMPFNIKYNNQWSKEKPFTTAKNVKKYSKGWIFISRVTLEKTGKGYNLWGYFVDGGKGQWLLLKNDESKVYVEALNDTIKSNIEFIHTHPRNYYVQG